MALVCTRKADSKRLASTAGQLLLLPTKTDAGNAILFTVFRCP
jgi:hypothetical protein